MPGDPAAHFFDWVFGRTLPFWLSRGVDRDAGGFHEALDASREPVVSGGKRTLVQARQVYVFSQAALLTALPGAQEAARQGVSFLENHHRHPDGGWRFRVDRDGGARDDRRDLYTHAFVLFGLAWHHRLSGDEAARRLADDTIDFVEDALTHPAGGYREGLDAAGQPLPGPRRQNPHMHLLEACLAWHGATGAEIWLARARRIAELFQQRFVVDGALREYFDDELRPADGALGQQVEPGHHFEWIWLLWRLAEATGEAAFAAPAAFYEFACINGLDAGTGAVIDMIDHAGATLDAGHRLWPQTEAVKAHLSRIPAGDGDARGRLDDGIAALFRTHLDGAAEGAWREHVAADGAPRRDDLPASSLYHLTAAAAELARTGLVGTTPAA